MLSNRIKMIDIWACFYVLLVMLLSILNIEFGIIGFILLFGMSIMFLYYPEYLICISIFLSSVSYFFFGAHEGILSIYTILAIILIFNRIILKKVKVFNYKSLILSLFLCCISYISYKFSSFNYTEGLLRMIYVIFISLLVGNFINLDKKKLFRIIPLIALTMAIGYIIVLVFNGVLVNGRLTIANEVNVNTFGKACALIVVSLFLAYYFNRKKWIYLLMGFVMIILEFSTGSRGSLVATILSIIITLICISNKKKKITLNIMKFGAISVIVIGAIMFSAKYLNLNMNRFDISTIIASGGNHRLEIFKTVIDYNIDNGYYIYGYGPGHDCTRRVISPILNRNFENAHNTFIESFGELGIFGLIATILIYVLSYKQLIKNIKLDKKYGYILALLLCITISGMTESYFIFIAMWLILAIARNVYNEDRRYVTKMNKLIALMHSPAKIFLFLNNRNIRVLSDETYLKLRYKFVFNKELDLDNPKSFNEKLQWLKLHNRKKEYNMMVDKYEAKKYVANIIGEEYIIPTIGVYDKFEDINFDKLPNQFVIKCTHDSGGLVICKDKTKLNICEAKKKIKKSLKTNYYIAGREWQYKDIKPRIIIEKYMEDKNNETMRDYKFFCFFGVPKLMYLSEGLEDHSTARMSFYDMDFQLSDCKRSDYKQLDYVPEKPKTFEKMKKFAALLSRDIPHLRVDFYEINGHLYFGELTFSTCSGFIPFADEEWNLKLGSWIKLNNKK